MNRFEEFKKRMLEQYPTIDAMFLENKDGIRAQVKKDNRNAVNKKFTFTSKSDLKKNTLYLQK